LGFSNRDYYGPFHDFSLPWRVGGSPVFAIKREIVAFLERGMGDGYFGLKTAHGAADAGLAIRSSTI